MNYLIILIKFKVGRFLCRSVCYSRKISVKTGLGLGKIA
jgi:hypothetical protein